MGGGLLDPGPILRLLDEDVATATPDGGVLLPWPAIASLSPGELRLLGLPPPAPWPVRIRSHGSMSDAGFRFEWDLNANAAHAIETPPRTGAIVRPGGVEYTLPSPIFELVSGLDDFNAAPPDDPVERIRRWTDLRRHLPEDAELDGHLRSTFAVAPTLFSLRPFVNDRGEADFEPVLGAVAMRASLEDPGARVAEVVPALTPLQAEDFGRQFRRTRRVREVFTLDDGFVFVSAPVTRALQVAHDIMHASPERRKQFLLDPRAHLRRALEDELDEETLESLFDDANLSDRVKAIGVRVPKVLAWLAPSEDPWLPPMPVALLVDGETVELSFDEQRELLQRVEAALQEGKQWVSFGESRIPVTTETRDELVRLVKAAEERAAAKPPVLDESPEPQPATTKLHLLIKGNLEELDWEGDVRPAIVPAIERPKALRPGLLLPHQKQALFWLQTHYAEGSRGGLLADDMGLGKTLTALAFLAWVVELERDRGHHAPALVVAPTGLLRNWEDEDARHLDRPGVGLLTRAYGSALKELRTTATAVKELEAGLPTLNIDELARADWVLTTYETLRDYQHSFGRVRWSVIVFDEAQKIKNPTTAMTDAAKAMQGNFVLAMTGTPVENRLADLWSIVDTAWPGYLGSLREFSQTYEPRVGPPSSEALAELQRKLAPQGLDGRPLMLRRMKTNHLKGLPERTVKTTEVEMPPAQAHAYATIVAQLRGQSDRIGMLEGLQRMRSVSLHPAPSEAYGSDEAFAASSARIQAALDILDQVRDREEKVLVFLDNLEVMGLLIGVFQRRYRLSSPPLVISGEVGGAKRKARVDVFQSRTGFDVMLLSPRAGGVGLTLTAANHVIHLDRWWNPAVEDQCSDRVYRIGQERPVTIHYPLAVHPEYGDFSFDRKLHRLLDRKRELSASVLSPTQVFDGEMRTLFEDVIEQAHG